MAFKKENRRDFFRKAGLATGLPFIADYSTSVGSKEIAQPELRTLSKKTVAQNKPYFPFILGNGEAHVLVGYSGSMGACAGHEHWQYNGISTGWYIPDLSRTPGYGVENILQCGYFIMRDYHAIGIDTFTQEFDYKSGLLKTNCEFANIGVIKVVTYFTSSNVLVHEFAHEIDNENIMLQFFIKGGANTETGIYNRLNRERSVQYNSHTNSKRVSNFELFSDAMDIQIVDCYNRLPGLEVSILKNRKFSVFIKPIEDKETGSILDADNLKPNHIAEWNEYQNKSKIEIDYNNLGRLYHTSLYVIRSHQHPKYGSISIGSYEGMWKNTVYSWDMAFSVMALLGANRLEQVEKALIYWNNTIPNLERITKAAGMTGAAVRSGISISGDIESSSKEDILSWRHTLTADVPIFVWQFYRYSGDKSILERYWDCMYKPLLFLVDNCTVEFEDHAEIIRSPGTNGKERIDGKYVYFPNPTITLLTTIEALSGFIEAANILNRKVDHSWVKLLPKLKKGVEQNRFNGILLAAKDSRAAITKSIHEVGLFGIKMDSETIYAAIDSFNTREGFFRWDNHGYKAIPWINTYISAALSQAGMAGASKTLLEASELTTTTFGFPEAIRPDGVFHKTWYPTVHASFVHSLNLLLLKREDNILKVFYGIPEDWGDVSFDELLVPFGLVVSANRKKYDFDIKIRNISKIEQNVVIKVLKRGRELGKMLELSPNSVETISF